jgi:hypothetical protein
MSTLAPVACGDRIDLPETGPEVVTVIIDDGALEPADVTLWLLDRWIVRWVNADGDRSYVITSDSPNLFESPALEFGDYWEQDMRNLPDSGELGYRAISDDGEIAAQVNTIWGTKP